MEIKDRNLTKFWEWLGIYLTRREIVLLKVCLAKLGSFKNCNLITTALQPFMNFWIHLWVGTDVRLIAHRVCPFSLCLEWSLVWLLRTQDVFLIAILSPGQWMEFELLGLFCMWRNQPSAEYSPLPLRWAMWTITCNITGSLWSTTTVEQGKKPKQINQPPSLPLQ